MLKQWELISKNSNKWLAFKVTIKQIFQPLGSDAFCLVTQKKQLEHFILDSKVKMRIYVHFLTNYGTYGWTVARLFFNGNNCWCIPNTKQRYTFLNHQRFFFIFIKQTSHWDLWLYMANADNVINQWARLLHGNVGFTGVSLIFKVHRIGHKRSHLVILWINDFSIEFSENFTVNIYSVALKFITPSLCLQHWFFWEVLSHLYGQFRAVCGAVKL